MNINRRSLITGGVFFVVSAPAIVRAQSLMSITAFDFVEELSLSTAFLDAQSIANEAARLLYNIGTVPRKKFEISWNEQRNVIIDLKDKTKTPSLKEFSQKVISPAIQELSKHGYRKQMGVPKLPPNKNGVVDAFLGVYKDTKIRYIESYNIHIDEVIGRFDIGDQNKLNRA